MAVVGVSALSLNKHHEYFSSCTRFWYFVERPVLSFSFIQFYWLGAYDVLPILFQPRVVRVTLVTTNSLTLSINVWNIVCTFYHPTDSQLRSIMLRHRTSIRIYHTPVHAYSIVVIYDCHDLYHTQFCAKYSKERLTETAT